MNQRSNNASGPWTLAAIAALAFVFACVAHETVGHGGACLLGGADITRLSSVYFRCSDGTAFTDAAGPMMNLVAGLACLAILKAWSGMAMPARLFLMLGMAFNLLWGTGYFVLTAITASGDWAFLLRGLAPAMEWPARIALGAVGLSTYLRASRLFAAMWPPRASLLVPYVVAGVVICASTLCYHGPVLPALREAVVEGFGSAVALPVIARRRIVRDDAGSEPVPANGMGWIVLAAIVCIAFFATLGRGYGSP